MRRLAAAAYGAFIIHPPVIVGLALAAHEVPVPAEVKFAVVLAAGVAGSFGIASLVMRIPALARLIGSGPRPPTGPRPGPPLTARPVAHAKPAA